MTSSGGQSYSELADAELFEIYESVRAEVLRRFEVPPPDPTGVSTWAGCPRCMPRVACGEHRDEAAAFYARVREKS